MMSNIDIKLGRGFNMWYLVQWRQGVARDLACSLSLSDLQELEEVMHKQDRLLDTVIGSMNAEQVQGAYRKLLGDSNV
jgi:hypothetical protein